MLINIVQNKIIYKTIGIVKTVNIYSSKYIRRLNKKSVVRKKTGRNK